MKYTANLRMIFHSANSKAKKTAYLHRQAEMSHVNKKIKLAVLNTDGNNLHCKGRHYFSVWQNQCLLFTKQKPLTYIGKRTMTK